MQLTLITYACVRACVRDCVHAYNACGSAMEQTTHRLQTSISSLYNQVTEYPAPTNFLIPHAIRKWVEYTVEYVVYAHDVV